MDQATPRALPHQQAQLSIMKHVRHQVAAGAGHLVDDHYLRPPDSSRGTGERITISRDVIEITVEVALQHVDDVIGRRAATVETLIDDRAFLILLREVVTIEAGIAGLPRVRQIDISELAVRKSFDLPSIRFHPGAGAQCLFSCDRHHDHMARSFQRRLVVDSKRSLPIRGAIEKTIDVVRCFQFDAIDRQNIVANVYICAGHSQWRTQFGIPYFVVVDTEYYVAAIY